MDLTLAQDVLLNCRVAYALTDRQLTVTQIGGAVEALQGDAASWIGRSLIECVPELVGCEPVLDSVLAGDLPRIEFDWINREVADGGTIYLSLIELPHRDAEGQIVGLLHLTQDCTDAGILRQQVSQSRNELRLARDQLARQNLDLTAVNAELRRLDDLKSTFVSVAAHELRSPLTAIEGFVEMLIDEEAGSLTDKQKEYLQIVHESSNRLLHVINNLLNVTRIEAGRVELVLEPTDLPGLVQSAIAAVGPQAAAKALRLSFVATPNLPPVMCDGDHAPRIVGNLLSNAVKYTPSGGQIAVNVDWGPEDGFLQVAVKDSGVGIPAEDQNHLFDRFFRASNVGATGAGGTGLGLYIARSLVELHGGKIWFSSEPGKGSTFFVTFPMADG